MSDTRYPVFPLQRESQMAVPLTSFYFTCANLWKWSASLKLSCVPSRYYLRWPIFFRDRLFFYWVTQAILNPTNVGTMDLGSAPQGVISLWRGGTHWVLSSQWWCLFIYLHIAQEYVISQNLSSLFNLQNGRLITLCWQCIPNTDGTYCFSQNQQLI